MSRLQWLEAWWPVELAWGNQLHELRLEEFRNDGTLTLRMEIPGVDPVRDIDVMVDDGLLCVSGRRSESEQSPERSEFHYGEFRRSVALPRHVDEDSIVACYHEGILEITMDVRKEAVGVRHVPVRAMSSQT